MTSYTMCDSLDIKKLGKLSRTTIYSMAAPRESSRAMVTGLRQDGQGSSSSELTCTNGPNASVSGIPISASFN